MRKPPEDVVRVAAVICREYPRFTEWLNEWRQNELDTLPYLGNSNVCLGQGRCQVLTELCKLIQDAPDLAAQLRKG